MVPCNDEDICCQLGSSHSRFDRNAFSLAQLMGMIEDEIGIHYDCNVRLERKHGRALAPCCSFDGVSTNWKIDWYHPPTYQSNLQDGMLVPSDFDIVELTASNRRPSDCYAPVAIANFPAANMLKACNGGCRRGGRSTASFH